MDTLNVSQNAHRAAKRANAGVLRNGSDDRAVNRDVATAPRPTGCQSDNPSVGCRQLDNNVIERIKR
jgi:hypothetical protein